VNSPIGMIMHGLRQMADRAILPSGASPMSTAGFSQSAPIPLRPPAESRAAITPEEAGAMLRATLALLAKWDLSAAERRVLLGRPSERTFQRWCAGEVASVPADTVYRLGDLLGIHKALRYMFADPTQAYDWVRRPNTAFGGRSALDLMLQGAPADIARVRAYLDAERGAW
jgi:hypothetical protein